MSLSKPLKRQRKNSSKQAGLSKQMELWNNIHNAYQSQNSLITYITRS